MTKKQLNAFKEGATDALLEGYKSDWHENLYYYNTTKKVIDLVYIYTINKIQMNINKQARKQ